MQCEAMKTATGKERKRTQAIAELLKRRTIAEAANACGITSRTLLSWLAEPAFRRDYDNAKRDLLESTINHLREGGFDAVAVLREISRNESSPAAARVGAARGTIELLLRGVALMELEGRIQKLEETLSERGTDNAWQLEEATSKTGARRI